ncbi:hypothetical protein NEH16_08280 [Streptomyces drozdowiczii]|uniref:Uncharacterized protein n=1 Tax=Streptomyces drozdowiczii TaxID=202862 RepID=A0ABY6PPY5_9ACTN|nr:hypothetical protein [Streptomyces drozdowiczii]UZK54146.1 hypothetical protein NEH16_08280 [Streptomyces drozdowiczii]
MPRAAERPPRPSLVGPAATLVLWLLLWLLLSARAVPYVFKPIEIITGPEWWTLGGLRDDAPGLVVDSTTLYYEVLVLILGFYAARVGGWAHVLRYFAGERYERLRLTLSVAAAVVLLWLAWTPKVPLLLVLMGSAQDWLLSGDRLKATVAAYTCYALTTAIVVWPIARAAHWGDALRDLRAGRAPGRPRSRTAPPPPRRTAPCAPSGPSCVPPAPPMPPKR